MSFPPLQQQFAATADMAEVARFGSDPKIKPAEAAMPVERADFGRRTRATGLKPAIPDLRFLVLGGG